MSTFGVQIVDTATNKAIEGYPVPSPWEQRFAFVRDGNTAALAEMAVGRTGASFPADVVSNFWAMRSISYAALKLFVGEPEEPLVEVEHEVEFAVAARALIELVGGPSTAVFGQPFLDSLFKSPGSSAEARSMREADGRLASASLRTLPFTILGLCVAEARRQILVNVSVGGAVAHVATAAALRMLTVGLIAIIIKDVVNNVITDCGGRTRTQRFIESLEKAEEEERGLRQEFVAGTEMVAARTDSPRDPEILKGVDIPVNLRCPLTLELFYDPVVTCFGHTYERGALIEHLNTMFEKYGLTRDPNTNRPMTSPLLYKNVLIRQLSDDFYAQQCGLTQRKPVNVSKTQKETT